MKIFQTVSNITFQKKLKAKASVSQNEESLPCKIYKLSSKDDRDYFKKINNVDDWENATFRRAFQTILYEPQKCEKLYVLEDKNNNCLGFMTLVDNKEKKRKFVEYLETCPKNAYENCNRNIKYIGETLLSFAVALGKKEKISMLEIPVALKSAEAFYTDKCGFLNRGFFGLYLSSEQFQNFLNQNEKHTGSKIKFTI